MKIRAIFILRIKTMDIRMYACVRWVSWQADAVHRPRSTVFRYIYVHQHIIHHVGNPFAIDVWASQLNIFIVTPVISFIYIVDHSLCEISKLLRVSMQFIQRNIRQFGGMGSNEQHRAPNGAWGLNGAAHRSCVCAKHKWHVKQQQKQHHTQTGRDEQKRSGGELWSQEEGEGESV